LLFSFVYSSPIMIDLILVTECFKDFKCDYMFENVDKIYWLINLTSTQSGMKDCGVQVPV